MAIVVFSLMLSSSAFTFWVLTHDNKQESQKV